MSKVAIVDSSALVALLKEDDTGHSKATGIMDTTTRPRLLLPTEILAETLNILGKKLGNRAEVDVGRALLERVDSGEITLIVSTVATLHKALDKRQICSGNPSFIDCLVMAYADEHRTTYIFGFDDTFRKNGYKLPGKG